MSRKRPQEEYSESLAGRFKRWLDGEKDPFVGTLEMKPPAPVQEPEEMCIRDRPHCERRLIWACSVSADGFEKIQRKNNRN